MYKADPSSNWAQTLNLPSICSWIPVCPVALTGCMSHIQTPRYSTTPDASTDYHTERVSWPGLSRSHS